MMLPNVYRVWVGIVFVALAALMVSACDKCGNSILHGHAGPLACKGDQPK